jgi:hypothetical protein
MEAPLNLRQESRPDQPPPQEIVSQHGRGLELVHISAVCPEVDDETFVADLGSPSVSHNGQPYKTGHLGGMPLEDRPEATDALSSKAKRRRWSRQNSTSPKGIPVIQLAIQT